MGNEQRATIMGIGLVGLDLVLLATLIHLGIVNALSWPVAALGALGITLAVLSVEAYVIDTIFRKKKN